MKAKIIILLSLCLTASVYSFAQVRTDLNMRERSNSSADLDEEESASNAKNARNYSIGFAIGQTKMYGDLPYSNPQPAYIGYFEKYVSQSFSFGEQVMIGDLSSRDPYTHLRAFNHYTSFDQHITVELGTIFSIFNRHYYDNVLTRIIGGLYAGVGIGIINNDIKRIATADETAPGRLETSNPDILTNTTALFVPINVGFNLHVPKILFLRGVVFNANFQYEDCFSDYIDGYKLPYKANKSNDVFTVMSLGFKFNLTHYGPRQD